MSSKTLGLVVASAMLVTACSGDDDDPGPVVPADLSAAGCAAAAQAVAAARPAAASNLRILGTEMVAATATAPEHCHVTGAINERTSAVDGMPYAIKFRLRMPVAWNGRFFMEGGGGSNGTLPTAFGNLQGRQAATALSKGFAVVATDSGHDNAVNNDPNAGGVSAFGRDPEARIDFGYRSYDLATQVGKSIVTRFYRSAPTKSYFVGCSEGGREAALMTQRFPAHYDGVVAGAPAISLPYHASYAPYLLKTFSQLAVAQGNVDANGVPLINKTYTDQDVQLIANAVLQACDALDGLADGISNNTAACTDAVVHPRLDALACQGAKTPACLSGAQISAFKTAVAGPKTSTGQPLYMANEWDPGIGGMSGTTFNTGFRTWWLGTYSSATNNAIKVTLSTPQHAMVWRTPPQPLSADQYITYEQNFDIDATEQLISATTPLYTESAKSFGLANSPDLDAFAARGGKLIVYHGRADSSHNGNDSARWFDAVNARQGGTANRFMRYFPVPGMNHCSGGPATDSFDMLTPLMNWVESGAAPESIVATASTPAYFGAASRTRPLCPYPQYAKYKGSGDINDAASFSCGS